MKKLILSDAILVATAQARTCPINKCDYLDPQNKVALDAYNKCSGVIVDQVMRATQMLAIQYPKFCIAWRAQDAEMTSALSDLSNPQLQAETDEVHRRFDDRILRTAEPEALQYCNLLVIESSEGRG